MYPDEPTLREFLVGMWKWLQLEANRTVKWWYFKLFVRRRVLRLYERDLLERDRSIREHLDTRHGKRPLTEAQRRALRAIIEGKDRGGMYGHEEDGNTNYPGS